MEEAGDTRKEAATVVGEQESAGVAGVVLGLAPAGVEIAGGANRAVQRLETAGRGSRQQRASRVPVVLEAAVRGSW